MIELEAGSWEILVHSPCLAPCLVRPGLVLQYSIFFSVCGFLIFVILCGVVTSEIATNLN